MPGMQERETNHDQTPLKTNLLLSILTQESLSGRGIRRLRKAHNEAVNDYEERSGRELQIDMFYMLELIGNETKIINPEARIENALGTLGMTFLIGYDLADKKAIDRAIPQLVASYDRNFGVVNHSFLHNRDDERQMVEDFWRGVAIAGIVFRLSDEFKETEYVRGSFKDFISRIHPER